MRLRSLILAVALSGSAAVLLFAAVSSAAVSPGTTKASTRPERWDPGETPKRGLREEVTASDESWSTDGVYGRLDGDLAGSLGVGARLPFDAGPLGPSAQATLHYYWTLGVYGRYADTFRSAPSGATRRVGGLGLELRPAFLLRWSLDLEHGPAWLDLLTDSLHVSAGAAWFEPSSSDAAIGAELGVGFGVPLMNHARGLWLEMRAALPVATPRGEPAAWLALAWHAVFSSPWLGSDREQ